MCLGIDVLAEFGGVLVPKWAPKWDQKLMFTWVADFSKIVLWLQRGLDFSGSIGSKNRSKIDRKMESKMECILASIFERFCWILGAKLGGKIDQKSIKNRIEKTMQKTKPFGTRLGPSSGCQGRRDVLRPSTARPDATRRDPARPNALEILSPGPPGPPPFRAKILVKKETVLDVLTRLGLEARRIFI